MNDSISKKKLVERKARIWVTVHPEGKHFCDCLTKNFRRHLGKKFGIHKFNEIKRLQYEEEDRT